MTKTIDGVGYVLDKPELSKGSCEGCAAQTPDGVLCAKLIREQSCAYTGVVWRKADDDTAERDTFEEACVERFIEWRKLGNVAEDNGAPATRESLCWKTAQGDYGVEALNAAWWGWRTGRAEFI